VKPWYTTEVNEAIRGDGMRTLAGLGCAAQALVLALYAYIGSVAFSYDLWIAIGKDVPWYLDLLGGFVTGPIAITAAIIGYIIQVAGVHMPLIG
jgi:hypothetical protein